MGAVMLSPFLSGMWRVTEVESWKPLILFQASTNKANLMPTELSKDDRKYRTYEYNDYLSVLNKTSEWPSCEWRKRHHTEILVISRTRSTLLCGNVNNVAAGSSPGPSMDIMARLSTDAPLDAHSESLRYSSVLCSIHHGLISLN